LKTVACRQVHDPLSAGGKIGVGATLGQLKGLEAGPSFEMVSGDPYDPDKAYKDSKLCNVLFARELARRLQQQGSPVCVTAFGPGTISALVSLKVFLQ
jgi:protochlorophyllide reductase